MPTHEIRLSDGAINGGFVMLIGRERGPVQLNAVATLNQGEEYLLRSPVAFPEGMNIVEVDIGICKCLNHLFEWGLVNASKRGLQPLQRLFALGFDTLRIAESRTTPLVVFCEKDRPILACPVIDFPEENLVHRSPPTHGNVEIPPGSE